jgi:hypothetical protein
VVLVSPRSSNFPPSVELFIQSTLVGCLPILRVGALLLLHLQLNVKLMVFRELQLSIVCKNPKVDGT